jgi:integrase
MQVSRKDILEDYLDSVYVLSHSKATVTTYRTAVTIFRKFLKDRYSCDENQIVSNVKDQSIDVYSLLREFVIYLDKNQYRGSTVRVWLAVVKGFLRHLGIKIYSEDCKQTVRIPKLVLTREEALTKEILVRLLRNLSPKIQTAVLVAIASGMRVGEIVQLKISDINFASKPVKVRIRAETTKTREEREAFLTDEASNSLKDYLKRHYSWKEGVNNEHLQDQVIFGRTSFMVRSERKEDDDLKTGYYSRTGNLLQKLLTTQISKIPELSKINGNGRKVIHFHAFRKYFRTVVGNACGRDFAEAMIGHKFYLSTYYNLSEAQKKELYVKAEPYLTLSDFARFDQTLHDLSARCKDLETRLDEFKGYALTNNVSLSVRK